MPMTQGLRGKLDTHADLAQLRSAARRDGMRPLRIAGCSKVAEGVTSISEVLSLTPSPQATE